LVLAAWDNEVGQQAGMPEAIEALRAVLPPARQPRQAGAPRAPRAGTKQEAVLALLRRPEGATVGQIAETTGLCQRWSKSRPSWRCKTRPLTAGWHQA
jgi:hypothetical protein